MRVLVMKQTGTVSSLCNQTLNNDHLNSKFLNHAAQQKNLFNLN